MYVRPPVTGLTTARWLQIKPTLVYIPATLAGQATRPEWVEAKRQDGLASYSGDPYPHLVVVDGIPIIEDGHHRRQNAIDEGSEWMLMRVWYIKPARCWRYAHQVHSDGFCSCFAP